MAIRAPDVANAADGESPAKLEDGTLELAFPEKRLLVCHVSTPPVLGLKESALSGSAGRINFVLRATLPERFI